MFSFNKKVGLSEIKETVGTGWLPPTPDLRDYNTEQKDIKEMAKILKLAGTPSVPATRPLPGAKSLLPALEPVLSSVSA